MNKNVAVFGQWYIIRVKHNGTGEREYKNAC